MLKKILFGLWLCCFIALTVLSQQQTTLLNRSIVGEFYGIPVMKTRLTKGDCENYFHNEDDEPLSIFATPWDAAISYYYQEHRERIMICVDAVWSRLIFTSETFPGPGLEGEKFVGYYGSPGANVGNFYSPRGIDISIWPIGGESQESGEWGAPHDNSLHIFVADHDNDRVMHLLYEHGENGPQIFPAANPVIKPDAQLDPLFPQMERPVDVTCDPFYWNHWGQILVLTKDRYIRSVNLSDRQWGSSIAGGPGSGSNATTFIHPVSICARQGYLVVADYALGKVVLFHCTQNSIDYRHVYYLGKNSHPRSVTIDQFKDVLVADEGQICIHKLHINDTNGDRLEYLTKVDQIVPGEGFRWLQCASSGTKEELWARFSDFIVFEGWSDSKGAAAFYNAADVIDITNIETYEEPGDGSLTLIVSFTLTGPIRYDLMEIRNQQNQRIYPPPGVPLSGVYGNAGEQEISVQLDEMADLRGNYTFNIIFDSEAEKFPDGEKVVQDAQRSSQFVAGYYPNPPDAPFLPNEIAFAGTALLVSWTPTDVTDSYYIEYLKNEENWSEPIKLDEPEFIIGANVMDNSSFRVRSANNRGFSQYSNISSIFVDFPYEQTIELAFGWNLVSSNSMPIYELPGSAKIPDCVRDIAIENLAIVKDGMGRFYIPDPLYNDIPRWEYTEGYRIKTLADNEHIIMKGRLTDPETPIELDVEWSYIAYFPQTSIEPEVALTTLLDPEAKFNILKNDIGEFFIPEVFNNIDFLLPGEGYEIYMNEAATLIYHLEEEQFAGANTRGVRQSVKNSDENTNEIAAPNGNIKTIADLRHYQYTCTDYFFPVIVRGIRFENYRPCRDDEIAAINHNNICIGAAKIGESFPVGLAVWRDDSLTQEIDGYQNLNEIRFKFTADSLRREIDLCDRIDFNQDRGGGIVPPYSRSEPLYFDHEFTADGNPLIPSDFFLSNNYPNPFNESTVIKYGLREDTYVELVVFDLQGRVVSFLVKQAQRAGYYTSVWSLKKGESHHPTSGIYFYMLSAGNFKDVKKMVLIK